MRPSKVIGPSFSAEEIADAVEAVIEAYREQRAPGARRGEVVPVVLEQRLLQVAITQAAGAQPFLVILGRFRRGDQLQQFDGQVLVGIRLVRSVGLV